MPRIPSSFLWPIAIILCLTLPTSLLSQAQPINSSAYKIDGAGPGPVEPGWGTFFTAASAFIAGVGISQEYAAHKLILQDLNSIKASLDRIEQGIQELKMQNEELFRKLDETHKRIVEDVRTIVAESGLRDQWNRIDTYALNFQLAGTNYCPTEVQGVLFQEALHYVWKHENVISNYINLVYAGEVYLFASRGYGVQFLDTLYQWRIQELTIVRNKAVNEALQLISELERLVEDRRYVSSHTLSPLMGDINRFSFRGVQKRTRTITEKQIVRECVYVERQRGSNKQCQSVEKVTTKTISDREFNQQLRNHKDAIYDTFRKVRDIYNDIGAMNEVLKDLELWHRRVQDTLAWRGSNRTWTCNLTSAESNGITIINPESLSLIQEIIGNSQSFNMIYDDYFLLLSSKN